MNHSDQSINENDCKYRLGTTIFIVVHFYLVYKIDNLGPFFATKEKVTSCYNFEKIYNIIK